MAGDRDTLLSMGFSEAKVKKALRVTKNSGLQPAMDWLLEHSEDPDPADDEAEDEEDSQIAKIESQPGVEARSLVCDDCGKKFRTHASAECSSTEHYRCGVVADLGLLLHFQSMLESQAMRILVKALKRSNH